MSKNTTKPASKTSKLASKTIKGAAAKGKKPAAKSTLTAEAATPKTAKKTALETAIANVKTVPVVKEQGSYLSTQDIANRLGRNWQFVNRQRHAGVMCDYVAVMQNGTYMYRLSDVRQWAKSRGLAFGRN